MNIKNMLEEEVESWALLGHPALMQRIVLEKGKAWIPCARPAHFNRLTPRNCFQNSNVLAELEPTKYKFVEGYAVNPELGMLVHHAWCVDRQGRVIDLTWEKPENCFYFGIKFSFSEVERWTDTSSSYSVLSGEMLINTDYIFEQSPKITEMMKTWKTDHPKPVAKMKINLRSVDS